VETRRRRQRLAVLLLGALAATAQSGAGRAASSWRRVDTPHFTVIGSVADRELGDVAAHFERFREALAQLLPSAATATIVPTVVIVFESEKAFDAFKPLSGGKPREGTGLIVPSPDIDYVGLVAGSRGFRTVFHGYSHLATANLGLSLPLWLTEGVAEYYSTFELLRGGNKASIGEPLTAHLMSLRNEWLGLDELRAVQQNSPLYDEEERRSVLYAESWVLVHYLLQGTPPRREHLMKYISATEAGTPEEEAWGRIFGQQAIEAGLRDYVDRAQSKMAGVTLTSIVESGPITVSPMPDGDADGFLGDFLFRVGREGEAIARLQSAAERPGGARARAELARISARQNRAADARALVARAGAPAGDWLADYAVGVAAAETFTLAPPEGGAAEISVARESLQRALRARPDLAHASHLLAGFALQAGDLDAARDASESASFLAPARFEYTLRLADVFTRRGEYAKARSVLGPLMTKPGTAAMRERVRAQLASVAAAEGAASTASTNAPVAEPAAPAIVLDLRRLRSGEERAAGMLARIDCDRKKGVTFHIRVDGRTEEYRTARFEDVEFISYRDDLIGDAKCGAREPEDLVYVTWKDGAPASAGAAASKTIVAVEFLPKDYKPKQ
jgi:Flp pilus assembly protein TadD